MKQQKKWKILSVITFVLFLVSSLGGPFIAKKVFGEEMSWNPLIITPQDWIFIFFISTTSFFLFSYIFIWKFLKLPKK